MLSYSVKLSSNNIKKDEVVWGEKYLSPDLSFVTGVTSQDYHLEKLNQIEASINNKSDILNIQSENVTREGYIVIKDKKYPVVDDSVFINGKYYYVNNGKIVVDNWLVERHVKGKEYENETGAYTKTYFIPTVITKTITPSVSNGNVSIDTIYWIENGKVTVDGNEYFFDRNEAGGGCLKYFEDGACLSPSEITDCRDIEYEIIEKASDFIKATKFTLTRDEDREINISDISFISHFTFIKYNDNYYPIELDDSNYYVCNINGTPYSAYTDDDLILTSSNVTDNENLSELGVYIKIGDGNLYSESIVQNSNNGRKIGLYLSDTYDNINTGDIIRAKKNRAINHYVKVEEISGETFVLYDGTRYEIYPDMLNTVSINEVEYNIISCDDTNCYVDIEGEYVPMKINGNTLERYGLIVQTTTYSAEETAEYNAQLEGALTAGEELTAEQAAAYNAAITGAEKAAGDTLTEEEANLYNATLDGAVAEGDEKTGPVTASYDIIHYSGVTISGIDYRVLEIKTDEDETISNFILVETGITHRLRVIETIGSSLIVCEPDLNAVEFSDDYVNEKVYEVCSEIVSESFTYRFYIKNPLFGEREVLPDNGKIYDSGATSTDAYQNVLDTLKLYANIGYIVLPINLEAGAEINMTINEAREKDFIELEKEKAINPIIDMERDVYVPKYIENDVDSILAYTAASTTIESRKASIFDTDLSDDDKKHAYIGSYTDFKPIREIRINFHFRTRDPLSWKINEEYNDISTSGLCNWFVTDYEPYKSIIDNNRGKDLMNVSDALDLLYFNNMDVYYQKKALEKSFARLTYYDDTDLQVQSLLHSSTVFVNEHDLFKKYIDNSRKNISDFMIIQEPNGAESPSITNKITVGTEYMGKHDPGKTYEFKDAKVTEENKRLSSRLSILNKYETDTSSEGFYLYIFKQYAENLHPKPIYMKIDFNHAKIGKTLPFFIPMKWETKTGESQDYVYPVSALTIGNADDLEEMKQGIPLSYVYAQSYIPIYAMYDFKNKEYAYIFDDRYVKAENGIAEINLFEIKIKNDDDADAATKATAVIDISNKIQVK